MGENFKRSMYILFAAFLKYKAAYLFYVEHHGRLTFQTPTQTYT